MDEEVLHDGDVQQSSQSEQTPTDAAPSESAVSDEAQAGAQGDGQTDGEQRERKYIPKERFDQVYARAKDAETKIQLEREHRARLEGELEAMKRQPPPQTAPTPPRYSAAQLQAMIDEGKATVGQVLAYQEETMRLEMDRKLDEKVQATLKASAKTSTLQQEMDRYKATVPEVTQEGTPERQQVVKEFNYLVGLGYDASDPRTELMAVRAALGSVETIQERRKSKSIPTGRETMQDIQASGGGKPQGEPDVLKKMTAAQRQHYQRMIDRNVYKGWDEVREELKFAATYR